MEKFIRLIQLVNNTFKVCSLLNQLSIGDRSALLGFLFFQFDLQDDVIEVEQMVEQVEQTLVMIQGQYMPQDFLLKTCG